MDHRAAFFLVSAALCAVLLWPCPPELRWVGVVLTATFLLLTLLSTLEHVSRHRRT